jgi:hypothetical protein
MPRKSRELVWIFENGLVAWGCKACGWIRPRSQQVAFGASFREVREDFNQHDCKQHRIRRGGKREAGKWRQSV